MQEKLASIIKTVDLRKAYRVGNEKVVALGCINLEIEEGQVCCILGTSGSGKSTLLNQLAGLEKPTRGDVYIMGKNVSKMTKSSWPTSGKRASALCSSPITCCRG